jgi:hypothetical protein
MLRTLLLVATLLQILACSEQENRPSKKDSSDECIPLSSSRSGDVVEGRYIVSIDESATSGKSSSAGRIFEAHQIARHTIGRLTEDSDVYLIEATAEQVKSLEHDPSIAIIEPERIISLCGCFSVIAPTLVTWNVTHTGYGDGSGKTAWIIDSGIELDHPDLNVDVKQSHSFLEGDDSPADGNGHGTHVAGIIGAKNNDFGTLGVASGATVVSLKVLDNKGEGYLSAIIKALSWVRQHGRAGDVANISLSLDESSTVLANEILKVASTGIYVTIAAGNDSEETKDASPANTNGKNVFTVAAVDSLGRFARFSNYGSDVDFAAPGVRILSSYLEGRLARMSGTSMAAPHVAGILLINNGTINVSGHASTTPDENNVPLAHQ